jgi:hypothetical protein
LKASIKFSPTPSDESNLLGCACCIRYVDLRVFARVFTGPLMPGSVGTCVTWANDVTATAQVVQFDANHRGTTQRR